MDVAFEKPVAFSLNFDGTVAPVGFTGSVKTLEITGNPRIERVADRITSDTDISATEACIELRDSSVDVYRISGLMTAGLPGRRRKFVPTRWAITAVDDTLSGQLKKEIARYPPVEEIHLFTAKIFGNRIVCLFLPGDWKFEMIEIWGKQSLWGGENEVIVQDREGMKKKGYSPISGAYYSARLAACEYLSQVQRSARGIILRSIFNDCWAPLGTRVIREAARKAMAHPPVKHVSLAAAVRQASVPLGSDSWLSHSTLIPEIRTRRTLI